MELGNAESYILSQKSQIRQNWDNPLHCYTFTTDQISTCICLMTTTYHELKHWAENCCHLDCHSNFTKKDICKHNIPAYNGSVCCLKIYRYVVLV